MKLTSFMVRVFCIDSGVPRAKIEKKNEHQYAGLTMIEGNIRAGDLVVAAFLTMFCLHLKKGKKKTISLLHPHNNGYLSRLYALIVGFVILIVTQNFCSIFAVTHL